ncbi:phosphoglycerate kinase, partial [Candidatus Saccharibacteria bacterium]|nr:phosphoglycerate kinase [Candidatus Saccharibacteria bacterium]
LDVPLVGGKVSDDARIEALLATFNHLYQNKAEVLIIGHAGRPKGKKDSKLSLEPVAERLSELCKKEIK